MFNLTHKQGKNSVAYFWEGFIFKWIRIFWWCKYWVEMKHNIISVILKIRRYIY